MATRPSYQFHISFIVHQKENCGSHHLAGLDGPRNSYAPDILLAHAEGFMRKYLNQSIITGFHVYRLGGRIQKDMGFICFATSARHLLTPQKARALEIRLNNFTNDDPISENVRDRYGRELASILELKGIKAVLLHPTFEGKVFAVGIEKNDVVMNPVTREIYFPRRPAQVCTPDGAEETAPLPR